MCKTKYPDLEDLVKALEKEYDEQKQIQKLQEINSVLLTQYEIRISDNEIIHPLRIEAYYYPYNAPGKFDDKFAHPSSKKVGNFGKLYFIEEKYGYPGIDLCLSLGQYYLSFLIKNSYIKDKTFKQMDLYEKFKDQWAEIEAKDDILHKITNNEETVFHTVRVGLPKERPLSKEVLASLIKIDMKGANKKSLYNFEKNYGKLWTIANYLYDHPEKNNAEWIRQILGYNGFNEINKCLSKIIEKREGN